MLEIQTTDGALIDIMNDSTKKRACFYTHLQGALYFLAFLAFAIADGITGLWMIEQKGVMGEANPLVRYLIINYGSMSVMGMKLWFGFIVLFIPFLIQKRSYEPIYWMVNGYLVSFIIAGTLASILNIQSAMNRVVFLSPAEVIFIFLSSVLILTHLGEGIDRRTRPEVGDYVECARNDIMTALVYIVNIVSKEKNIK